jgi:tetratricopeptide (TPR) repeat protein
LDTEGQTFVFQAGEAGTYELKFYRQDFIRDYIVNDLVTLIVEEQPLPAIRFGAPVERGTVTAGETSPGAGTTPPPAASPALEAAPSVSVTLPAVVPEAAEPDSPQEYLRRAREEREAGHIPQALAVLDQFMAQFPRLNDEALWLYAQLYEAPGPSRNIRSALDCYRRLINEYPQSTRYADARRRIAYLERYYINIQ